MRSTFPQPLAVCRAFPSEIETICGMNNREDASLEKIEEMARAAVRSVDEQESRRAALRAYVDAVCPLC